MPPVNIEALESILLRVSEMVCELPLLKEMDINPLIVDENGVLAADARVVLEHTYAHIWGHTTYAQHMAQHMNIWGQNIWGHRTYAEHMGSRTYGVRLPRC